MLLVECISCFNWMQIAGMATLMFCPCCQSVVPIIQQNAVRTHEEAKQLMRDWQLVERLQNEDASEGTAAISGSATAVASESGRELTFSSWREYVMAIFSTSGGEEEQRSNWSSWTNMLSLVNFPSIASGACIEPFLFFYETTQMINLPLSFVTQRRRRRFWH